MSAAGQLNKSEKVAFTFIDGENRRWFVPAFICADCGHSYPAYATEYKHDSSINEDMAMCNGEAITECPYCVGNAKTEKVWNLLTGVFE